MTPSPNPPAGEAGRLSRRDVLRGAGVVAVGGLGVAAGYGLRGVVDSSAPIGAAGPSASAVGLVAAATGAPGPSGAPARRRTAEAAARLPLAARPRPAALLVGTPAAGTAPRARVHHSQQRRRPGRPHDLRRDRRAVWVRPGAGRQATDFQVIDWGGAPALAWWEGKATIGVGDGEYVVADAGYAELARVAAGGHADLHELHLTPSGTALLPRLRGRPDAARAGAGLGWLAGPDLAVRLRGDRGGRGHGRPCLGVALRGPHRARRDGGPLSGGPGHPVGPVPRQLRAPRRRRQRAGQRPQHELRVQGRPCDRRHPVAARRHVRGPRAARWPHRRAPARRPPPARRHDHDLRQRAPTRARPRPRGGGRRDGADRAGGARLRAARAVSRPPARAACRCFPTATS